MSIEIWKPVKGFEGLYEVSNLGRVRSLDRMVQSSSRNNTPFEIKINGVVLKQYIDRYGYKKVILYKRGKAHYFTVHRLVASAFIENPYKKNTVDHIDCDRTNNHVDNLRWADMKENLMHSHNLGRQRCNARPIIATSPNGEKFRFHSQHEAERALSISQANIGKCANGLLKTVKGWRFEFDQNENLIQSQ